MEERECVVFGGGARCVRRPKVPFEFAAGGDVVIHVHYTTAHDDPRYQHREWVPCRWDGTQQL